MSRFAPLLWSLCAVGAFAQEASQEPPTDPAPAKEAPLTPPELTKFVQAVYPPEAETAGLQGDVILEIDVDAKGRVTRVEIKQPAGHGFDEAAKNAALQFEFTPGRAGDTPGSDGENGDT